MTEPGFGAFLDQLDAATTEARGRTLGLAGEGPFRHDPHLLDPSPVVAALLYAALRSSVECGHLQPNAPQTVLAILPLRRIMCQKCAVLALNEPEPEDDGQCDWCRAPTEMFYAAVVQWGPMIVYGDACADCRAVIHNAESNE